MPRYRDRTDAGKQLAASLLRLGLKDLGLTDAVVLGLPCGGVPVAFEVAGSLRAQLDVIVVRKLGVPFRPELAMGAVGEGPVRVINEDVLERAHVTPGELAALEAREYQEIERRVSRLRGSCPKIPLAGRSVVVVDDGIATGATARAACHVTRAQGASRVILAAPVAASGTATSLRADADQVIVLQTPTHLVAVGACYEDFAAVSETAVIELMHAAAR